MLLLSEAFIRYNVREVAKLELEKEAQARAEAPAAPPPASSPTQPQPVTGGSGNSPPLPVMAPALAGQTANFNNPVPGAVQNTGQVPAPVLTSS